MDGMDIAATIDDSDLCPCAQCPIDVGGPTQPPAGGRPYLRILQCLILRCVLELQATGRDWASNPCPAELAS